MNNKLIHFDIDIVLMFLNSLSAEQREQFLEDRKEEITNKLTAIKGKIAVESKTTQGEFSQLPVYTYLEHHLKAEMAWLKTL